MSVGDEPRLVTAVMLNVKHEMDANFLITGWCVDDFPGLVEQCLAFVCEGIIIIDLT